MSFEAEHRRIGRMAPFSRVSLRLEAAKREAETPAATGPAPNQHSPPQPPHQAYGGPTKHALRTPTSAAAAASAPMMTRWRLI